MDSVISCCSCCDSKLSLGDDPKVFILAMATFSILITHLQRCFLGRVQPAKTFFLFLWILSALICFYFQNLHHLLDLASSCDGGRANWIFLNSTKINIIYNIFINLWSNLAFLELQFSQNSKTNIIALILIWANIWGYFDLKIFYKNSRMKFSNRYQAGRK